MNNLPMDLLAATTSPTAQVSAHVIQGDPDRRRSRRQQIAVPPALLLLLLVVSLQRTALPKTSAR